MVKYVKVDGVTKPAIVMDCVDDIQAIREFRKCMVDVLTTCLSSDQAKDFTSSTSLWYLVHLIDETTIECPNKKGGEV